MMLWILIAGQAPLPARCGAADFKAAAAQCPDTFAPPPEGYRPIKLGKRRLLVSPRGAAVQTAALLWPDAAAETEPLLDELPLRPVWSTSAALPAWLWRLLSKKEPAAARADALLDRLEESGRDCVLVTHPLFAAALMDRARLRGCVSQRNGLGAVRPWEHILVSRRTDHCGGCDHNCLLSNPGCNIGRDKAARKSG